MFKKFLSMILVVLILLSQYTSVFAVKQAPARAQIKPEILVKYKDGSKHEDIKKSLKKNLKLKKLERKKKIKSNIELLEIDKDDDIRNVLAELKRDNNVEYAQENYQLEVSTVDDPLFTKQWYLQDMEQSASGYVYGQSDAGKNPVNINCAKAWDVTMGSSDTVVGILDSGIDINHEDLKDSIYINSKEIPGNGIDDDKNGYIDDVNGWDFSNNDNTVYDSPIADEHGTAVTGVIAASANDKGIRGVAPKVKVLPLKFISGQVGYTSDAIEAIEYAESLGVKIINCSFGGVENNTALKEAMKDSGMLFVCSAGNSSSDVSLNPVYPACFGLPNIISVAATNDEGYMAVFSNYGSRTDVAAPGTNILTTLPENSYGYKNGTSVAAAVVTGIAALVKSHSSAIEPLEIASRIKNNVSILDNLRGKILTNGRVNAYEAITNTNPNISNYDGSQGPTDETVTDSVYNAVYTMATSTVINEQLHYGESGINPASGNFSFTCTDISMKSLGNDFKISRTYNSKGVGGMLGKGWMFSFEGSISVSGLQYTVVLPNGVINTFYADTNNNFHSLDSRNVLSFTDTTWKQITLKTKDNIKYGFSRNTPWDYSMTWVEDRNGNRENIEYENIIYAGRSINRVKSITDTTGRHFTLSYTDRCKISSITDDSTENKVSYIFENTPNCFGEVLTKVIDYEGNIMNYGYSEGNYGGSVILTSVRDNNNKDIARLSYYCYTPDMQLETANYLKVKTITNTYGNTYSYVYTIKFYSGFPPISTTIQDSNGRQVIHWFDNMNIIKTQNEEGKISIIEYSNNDNISRLCGEEISTTDYNGNKKQFERDSRGNITKITNSDDSIKQFAYDANNNLIKEVDEERNYTEYVYDSNMVNMVIKANLLRKLNPSEDINSFKLIDSNKSEFALTSFSYYTDLERIQLGYKVLGLLKAVTDPRGNVTTYQYDTDGNLLNETAPSAPNSSAKTVTNYHYNNLRQLDYAVTPEGFRTSYTYDKNNLLLKTILNNGEVVRTTYDPTGRKTKEIYPKQYNPSDDLGANSYGGNYGTRYYYYDNSDPAGGGGKLKEVIDAENNSTKYTYDIYGNVKIEIKANGAVLEYEYDVMNRPSKIYFRDSVGATATLLEEYSYSILADGKIQKTVKKYMDNSKVATTVFTYDYAGRLIEQQNPDNTHIYNSYYKNGKLKTTTDPKGNVSSFYYDGLNRLIEEWTPFENVNGTIYNTVKKHTYDKNNNIINEKVTRNKPGDAISYDETGYEYNCRTQLVKVITYNNGTPVNYTQYFYDGDGNKVRMYTGLSSPLAINGLDNVTPTGDSDYSVTKYEYNHMGKLTKMIDPLGNAIQNNLADSYDKNGNLTKQIDRNGNTISMAYDNMNRLLSKSVFCPDASKNASYSFTYDALGNKKTMTGGGINTTYDYDQMGRLTTETESNGIVKSYGYNRASNRTSFTLAQNGATQQYLTYDYDLMGRLNHVYENGATVIATYTYDINGNRESLAYNNGDLVSYTYNLANKLKTLSNKQGTTMLSSYSYNYFLDGNQESKVDTAGMTSYIYDGLGRLGTVTEPGNVITSYLYDESNNRKQMAVTGVSPYTVNYTYDKSNRLTVENNSVKGITNYSYDNNGNQITKDVSTYKYDGFNQLIQSIDGVNTVNYCYNGDGLRNSKTVNGSTTTQIWDGDQLALELNNGVVTNKYLRGINLIAADLGGNRSYYLFNGHGDVTGLANTAGTLTKSYDYDAFGNQKGTIDPADTNKFRYGGEYWDDQTGTYYLRARYYNPGTGRFISEDSVTSSKKNSLKSYYDALRANANNSEEIQRIKGEQERYSMDDPLSLNLYTYCHNDPINYNDPSGHDDELIKLAVAIAYVEARIQDKQAQTLKAVADYGKYIGPEIADAAVYAWNGVSGWAVETFNLGSSTPVKTNWGTGFNTFSGLKKYLGSAGEGYQWHHIVEQSQIDKSGFNKAYINNTNNIIALTKEVHQKISAYYSSKDPLISEGKTVREWLAGKSFQYQYDFGKKVLERFGDK